MRKIFNNKYTILALAIITLSTACDKKLDVSPMLSVDASTAITNAADVNAAVVGCYSILGGGALYGTNMLMLPDLYAANSSAGSTSAARYATWSGTFQSFRQVYNKTMNRDNAEASRIWIEAYKAINMANIVLESLGVVSDASEKVQYQGEALFVRGILHFELVRFYGLPWGARAGNTQPGVVIKTTATRNAEVAAASSPRSSVADVYAQVIKDLTDAAAILPDENGTRANKFTALAFLSRVYLQQGNYTAALAAANSVIQSNNFRMNAAVMAVFTNKNTRESVWEIQQNEQNNAGTSNDGMATFFSSKPGIGRADFRIPTGVVSTYPANDLRSTEWFYVGTGARPGNTYCNKWNAFAQNLPIIRIAEMYLTRAECNIRLSSSVGATPSSDLAMVKNSIRTNTTAAANPILDDILNERVLELAYEGVRIHDIKRLKGSVDTYAWNDNKLVFPIPQREVDASKGVIAQNPGY